MRADEERALRDRPAHDLPRALEDVLLGEARLQLAPDVDALDQRAGLVPARLAGRERGVEMEMAVDERRRDEPRFRVELLRAVGGERLADPRPASVLGGEIDEPPVEQARVAHDEVHARESTGRGTRATSAAVPAVRIARRDAERRRRPARERAAGDATRTGTTPGRRTCERLSLVLPGTFTRRSACDGTRDAPGHDDDAVAQPASTWSVPTSRGVGGPAATRRRVAPRAPRAKSATRPVVRSSTCVRPAAVDVRARELARPAATASSSWRTRRARPCRPST